MALLSLSRALWDEITAHEKELCKLRCALQRGINIIKCYPTLFYQTRKNHSPVWSLQHLPLPAPNCSCA